MGQNIYGVDIGTSNFKMCCKDKDKIRLSMRKISLQLQIRKIF